MSNPNMSNTPRKRRSPAEMIEAYAAKLAAAQVAQAADSFSDRPEVKRIEAGLADLRGMVIAQQRGFAKGPQSFEARRNAHLAWLAEIEAAEAYAKVAGDHWAQQRDALTVQRDKVLDRLVKGEVITPAEIDSIIAQAFEASDAVADAQSVLNIRAQQRKENRVTKPKEDGAEA